GGRGGKVRSCEARSYETAARQAGRGRCQRPLSRWLSRLVYRRREGWQGAGLGVCPLRPGPFRRGIVTIVAGAHRSPRDRAIAEAVRTFRQLTSKQIEALFFAGGEADTRSAKTRRALRRLVAAGVIARMPERSMSGWAYGRQGYCYVPPRSGARMRDPH